MIMGMSRVNFINYHYNSHYHYHYHYHCHCHCHCHYHYHYHYHYPCHASNTGSRIHNRALLTTCRSASVVICSPKKMPPITMKPMIALRVSYYIIVWYGIV